MGASTSKSNKDKNSNNIFKITTKLVNVRIQTKSSIWEKAFNIEETLEYVAQNFKNENDMDTINKNYFIEWTFNNSPIEMNKQKLKDFIMEKNIKEGSPIEICQKIKPKNGNNHINTLEFCEIVGKPLFNPFEIITFITNQKLIKIKTYNKRQIAHNELDKFSVESAYCNGNNYLFISGGTDPSSTRAPLDFFWEIDLKTDILDNPIKMGIQKKNHSMIYADKKVFIIGGDNEKCIYYDTEKKTMNNLGNLNLKRFEPSLIRHENNIFCFDSARKKDNDQFSLEKIDLNNLANPIWEIIKPKISPSIGENVYSQKFFGVVEDYKQNIIFLGGIYDNSRSLSDGDDSPKMNTRYNISKNTIEKSDISFQEISLSEKAFLPLDDKTFFILPNFSKRSPKIVYYNRERNDINITNYTSNTNMMKKRLNYNIRPNTQIIASLTGLNFDMPGLHKEKDIMINNPNPNDDLIGSRFNNDITMNNPNLFKNESSNSPLDYKKSVNNNINTDFNSKSKNNIIIENNINQSKLFNQDIKENINLKNSYNPNINIESSINPNIDANIKPRSNYEEEINNNNIIELNNPKKDIDINVNTNLDLKTNNNNELITNTNNEVLNKIPTIDINNPNDIKIEIHSNTIENNKKVKTIKYPISYRHYYNSKINFHNSVDDPCNIIKRIKIKNLPYPVPISAKLIKQKAKQILKEENNQLRINNY